MAAQNDRFSSLHISNLNQTTNESSLFEVVSNVSQPLSLRVLSAADGETKRAFVNFLSRQEALKVKEALNYTLIGSNIVTIDWKGTADSRKKPFENQIFLEKVPAGTTQRNVYEEFMKYGDICRVVKRSDSVFVVIFHEPDSAMKAYAASTETPVQFQDQIVEISLHQDAVQPGCVQVVFKNFPDGYGESDIQDLAEEHGVVQKVTIRVAKKSKDRMAFVQYSSKEMADDAISSLHNTRPDDKFKRALCVELSRPHGQQDVNISPESSSTNDKSNIDYSCSIHVSGFDKATTEEELTEFFLSFGPVKRVVLMRDKGTNQIRGDGFVNFVHRPSARKALEQNNLAYHRSKKLKISRHNLDKSSSERRHPAPPRIPVMYPPPPPSSYGYMPQYYYPPSVGSESPWVVPPLADDFLSSPSTAYTTPLW